MPASESTLPALEEVNSPQETSPPTHSQVYTEPPLSQPDHYSQHDSSLNETEEITGHSRMSPKIAGITRGTNSLSQSQEQISQPLISEDEH